MKVKKVTLWVARKNLFKAYISLRRFENNAFSYKVVDKRILPSKGAEKHFIYLPSRNEADYLIVIAEEPKLIQSIIDAAEMPVIVLKHDLQPMFDPKSPHIYSQVVLFKDKQAFLLAESHTYMGTRSLRKNKQVAWARTADLLFTAMKNIDNQGNNTQLSKVVKQVSSISPSFLQKATLFSQRLLNSLANRRATYQWFLLYKFGTTDILTVLPQDFQTLFPPKDKIWADPFCLEKEGKYYIFFEEMDINGTRGWISVMQINEMGMVLPPQKIIEEAYHLSFPFIFEYKNKLYLMPETAENNTIQVYECVDFPYKWRFKQVLMPDTKASDSVLFFHNNLWWLFTNIVNPFLPTTCNFIQDTSLFYAKDLFSANWQSHPQNPIITDVRKSLSAGKIVQQNNKIYHVAQICTPRYGFGVQISEITKLSKTEFEMQDVRDICADDKEMKAFHTLNFLENMAVADGLRRCP